MMLNAARLQSSEAAAPSGAAAPSLAAQLADHDDDLDDLNAGRAARQRELDRKLAELTAELAAYEPDLDELCGPALLHPEEPSPYDATFLTAGSASASADAADGGPAAAATTPSRLRRHLAAPPRLRPRRRRHRRRPRPRPRSRATRLRRSPRSASQLEHLATAAQPDGGPRRTRRAATEDDRGFDARRGGEAAGAAAGRAVAAPLQTMTGGAPACPRPPR